jgi:hypothetical protein
VLAGWRPISYLRSGKISSSAQRWVPWPASPARARRLLPSMPDTPSHARMASLLLLAPVLLPPTGCPALVERVTGDTWRERAGRVMRVSASHVRPLQPYQSPSCRAAPKRLRRQCCCVPRFVCRRSPMMPVDPGLWCLERDRCEGGAGRLGSSNLCSEVLGFTSDRWWASKRGKARGGEGAVGHKRNGQAAEQHCKDSEPHATKRRARRRGARRL